MFLTRSHRGPSLSTAARCYAAVLLRKPEADVTARESLAAREAVSAYLRGASAEHCRELFNEALLRIVE